MRLSPEQARGWTGEATPLDFFDQEDRELMTGFLDFLESAQPEEIKQLKRLLQEGWDSQGH